MPMAPRTLSTLDAEVDRLQREAEDHRRDDQGQFGQLRQDIVNLGDKLGKRIDSLASDLQGQINQFTVDKARAEGKAEGLAEARAAEIAARQLAEASAAEVATRDLEAKARSPLGFDAPMHPVKRASFIAGIIAAVIAILGGLSAAWQTGSRIAVAIAHALSQHP